MDKDIAALGKRLDELELVVQELEGVVGSWSKNRRRSGLMVDLGKRIEAMERGLAHLGRLMAASIERVEILEVWVRDGKCGAPLETKKKE